MKNSNELKKYQGIIFDMDGKEKINCTCYSLETGKKIASGSHPGCELILSLTAGIKNIFTFQPNGPIESVKVMIELFEKYCTEMSPKRAYMRAGWEVADLVAAGRFN